MKNYSEPEMNIIAFDALDVTNDGFSGTIGGDNEINLLDPIEGERTWGFDLTNDR